MSTFRDEEILIEQTQKTPGPHFAYMTVDLSVQDCQLYGHSWRTVGTAGAKCCTQCGITGYCPGCTSRPPQELSLIHISEPTRLGMISYAVFCLKKKKQKTTQTQNNKKTKKNNKTKKKKKNH